MSIQVASPAKSVKIIENEKVIITRWIFTQLGDHTTWHRHRHDYVVVPLFDGDLEIDVRGERTLVSLNNGVPYFRNAGIEHDVINANNFPCEFIEIELKDQS